MVIQSNTVENVLPQLYQWAKEGQRVCLATLYFSDGSSPRPRGSQMAVSEDGQWFGYLSGGCAEDAIASEAVAVMQQGKSRSVRYGVGSPYLDIKLPCGAGIDVWFEQGIDATMIEQLLTNIQARSVAGIETLTAMEAPMSKFVDPNAGTLVEPGFRRWYCPQRRLYIIGAGPAVAALAALASSADYQVKVMSPDQQTLSDVSHHSVDAELLQGQAQIDDLPCDPWTSVVLMFHEHERETAILNYFLNQDVYYIGALGSRRTHSVRLQMLMDNGASEQQCGRIHGPVGLDIQARTPSEIAISVLAELTEVYQRSASPLLEECGILDSRHSD